MFGKLPYTFQRENGRVSVTMFQSPCAGNMFGKNLVVQQVIDQGQFDAFQSPCAGNMFGKNMRI
jgi:hypothetical protein